MYTGMKHLHSMLAYILLAGLVISILYALFAFINKKTYNRKMALLGFISSHLQLVVGFILYFLSPYGVKNFSGSTMGDSLSRFRALEHPLLMLIAIIVITIGYSKAKKLASSSAQKANRTVLIFYIIGLLLIIARLPWIFDPIATFF